jgi:hypothetical protein
MNNISKEEQRMTLGGWSRFHLAMGSYAWTNNQLEAILRAQCTGLYGLVVGALSYFDITKKQLAHQ